MRKIRQQIWLISALIIAITAVILLIMGRPPICTCGTVRLWEGAVNSAGNSQHIADWYSFSHIIHGFLFYFGGWLLLRQWLKADTRWSLAIVIEAAWEIAENSPFIIERYRIATIALGYTGDSVLNSMSDIIMMSIGFWLASIMPWRATLLIALLFELFTLVMIRDNLTLNILMLTYPIDAIKLWQAGL